MADTRKPWEIPVQYNDDRFVEPEDRLTQHDVDAAHAEEFSAAEVEERINRPDVREERTYECTDTTPINYGRGPHNDELDVETNVFDSPDDFPVPYENGPHDEEMGEDFDEATE